MATNRDHKRTVVARERAQAIRTVRKNRKTEQTYTTRSFDKLLRQGL